MKQKIIKENIVKNLIIALALVLSYFPIKSFLGSLQIVDYSMVGVISSLLIMAFLFADYAFTYTSSNLGSKWERMLYHSITTIIMYGTGALLEISILAINLGIQKNFVFLGFIAFLFYISLVLYDFWDLNRALKNYK
ncbi:MAG: hypothetical protein AAB871_03025 [Patescibacteria group bacterium]